MKKATKLLSIVLVFGLLVGIVPMTAFAYGEITTDDPVGVLFNTPIEVGVKYEGEIQGDEPLIDVKLNDGFFWSGYAKSFTVTLDAYTPYRILATVGGDDAVWVDRAIAVYKDGELFYDYYEYGYTDGSEIDLFLDLWTNEAGEYQILLWGYCQDEAENDLFDYTYVSLFIDESFAFVEYDTKLELNTPVVTTIYESNPKIYEYAYYGSAIGFNADLEAGKIYKLTLETDILADTSSPVSVSFEFATNDGGTLHNFDNLDEEDGCFEYVIRPTDTANIELLCWGEVYVSEDDKNYYGEDISLTFTLTELTVFYFDIANEDDFAAFAEDVYYRNYKGQAVVAEIYGNLDLSGYDLAPIDTNATALLINGMYGGSTITALDGPLVYAAKNLFVENITVKNDYEFDDCYDFGYIVGYADTAVIKNCHAVGSVTANNEIEDAGGIYGEVNIATVIDCTAKVDISSADGGLIRYVGGIGGYSFTVECHNTDYVGNIMSENTTEFYAVGGIIGYAEYSSIFENVTAEGKIKYTLDLEDSEYYFSDIGGLVGYLEDYNVFNNCIANVSLKAPYGTSIGGFVGCIDESNEFYNCVSEGTVTGDDFVGGFVGNSSCCGYNLFANCYATGDVLGAQYVGGFIGIGYMGDTFTACYAAGNVVWDGTSNSSDYVGMFIGSSDYQLITHIACCARSNIYNGGGAAYGYDTLGASYISEVDFSDIGQAENVQYHLNRIADEVNEQGEYRYELYNWSIDNEDNLPKFVEKPKYLAGDANLNGTVDSVDYLFVKRYCLGTYELDEDALVRADINGNGSVDSVDYLLVKRIVLGTYSVK